MMLLISRSLLVPNTLAASLLSNAVSLDEPFLDCGLANKVRHGQSTLSH